MCYTFAGMGRSGNENGTFQQSQKGFLKVS